MLTPHDKFLSRTNDTIQIVVTTSCDILTCSNCTQLLPFRKDYRHMSLPCFIRAVKSLIDWPGVVALFGGNPCSHPQFNELCEILCTYIKPQSRRGIWSNALLGHGQAVRRTFYPDGRFNLNVHKNLTAAAEMSEWLPGKTIHSSVRNHSWHSPILMDRKDLGVGDKDWEDLREVCDINRRWSAAIVERGGKPYAYFCEVAAALDGIKGENHGTLVHSGWWQASMAQFEGQDHQVSGCCDQGCGVPLAYKGHQDIDEVYDVTTSFLPYTSLKKSIVALKHHVDEPLESAAEVTDYLRLREGD